ncbi:thiopeptide-type bacteriocin biosynthesis protein [Marinifilum sp. RC60d5]|uniref:thiopeptide-type bacteriocin biosynthesis protein n=1 Tax=Marinifilum sp. RC60d5 TaxID=3458414 RepID=UPI00403555F2
MIESQSIVKRTFILGDEWLYYKLYCGPKTADDILVQIIKPVAEKLLSKKIIDKWFFIRYTDPKTHLRVRFHYNNPEYIYHIISLINNASLSFIENDLLWKIQTDTYQREIERYGENTIELAEELFFHDSEMIINMIDMIEGDEGEIIRWLFAVKAIDSLLNDFNYDDQQKLDLLESLKEGFGREFGMNKMLKLQLDKKFRNKRKEISEILNKELDSQSKMKPLFELLELKSLKIKRIVDKILLFQKEEMLVRSLDDLMGSYIHMLLNRLFKSKQRLHEMVLYDFLYRNYKSEIAKKKYKPQLQKVG